jgi:uncharacterized membrane protein
MTDTVLIRLDELAGRMRAVERRLGVVERATRGGVPSAIGTEAEADFTLDPGPGDEGSVVPRDRSGLEPPARHVPTAGVIELKLDEGREAAAVPARVPAAPPPIPARKADAWAATQRAAAARTRPQSQAAHAGDLESVIGRNWTSWVGAVVVVIGVCFFLKYAWEQGWLAMPPAGRVAAAILTGVGFGVAGEWARRREQMTGLAATLGGAGVAIVMAALFAAATMFDPAVLSRRAAVAGVSVAAAVAIWRAIRADTLALAVVAMVGAYLAPAVLHSGRDESPLLMAYLAALTGVGLTLAHLRPRWGNLRWLVFTLTGLWVGAWLLWFGTRGMHRPLGLAAVSVFFAGFLGEAYLAATRLRGGKGGATDAAGDWLEGSLATVSMLATAAAVGAYWVLLPAGVDGGRGGWFHLSAIAAVTVGLASVHGLIAVSSPSRVFARSSVLQAAALLTLAVPLALGNVAITVAWGGLGVALAALAWRRPDATAARAWAVALLGLALGRLFTLDLADGALRAVRWHVGGQGVSAWLLLAWALAVAAHGVAWLVTSRGGSADAKGPAPRLAELGAPLAAAGTGVFFVAGALYWGGGPLTLLALTWVAGLVALAGRRGAAGGGDGLAYGAHAGVALFVVACKWAAFDGIGPTVRAWDQVGTTPPLFNPFGLAGVAIALLAVRLGAASRDADARGAAAVAAGVVAFLLLNLETLRGVDYFAAAADPTVKLVAISVLWGLVGLGSVVVGFARGVRPLRYAGLALLGVTLGKILFVDLATVPPVFRILSFLAVGAVLLCTSFVYHRVGEGGARAEDRG